MNWAVRMINHSVSGQPRGLAAVKHSREFGMFFPQNREERGVTRRGCAHMKDFIHLAESDSSIFSCWKVMGSFAAE